MKEMKEMKETKEPKKIKEIKKETKLAISAQSGFVQAYKQNMLYISATLGASAAMVYFYLLCCRNGQTGLCFPSYNKIAEATQYSRRYVIDMIKNLTDIGYIEYKQGGIYIDNKNKKTKISNSYDFPFENFPPPKNFLSNDYEPF